MAAFAALLNFQYTRSQTTWVSHIFAHTFIVQLFCLCFGLVCPTRFARG